MLLVSQRPKSMDNLLLGYMPVAEPNSYHTYGVVSLALYILFSTDVVVSETNSWLFSMVDAGRQTLG